MSYFDIYVPSSASSNDFSNSRSNDVVFMPSSSNSRYCIGTTSNTLSEFQIDKGLVSMNANVSMSSNLVVPYIVASNVTASNVNFTGSLLQNGVAYVGSQWTGTVGGPLAYSASNNTLNYYPYNYANSVVTVTSPFTYAGIQYTVSAYSEAVSPNTAIGAYNGNSWRCSFGYYNPYTGTRSSMGDGYMGEYFQLQISNATSMSYVGISIQVITDLNKWRVYGSSNGSSWNVLIDSTTTISSGIPAVFYFSNPSTYTYYRFVPNTTVSNVGYCDIANFSLISWTSVVDGGNLTCASLSSQNINVGKITCVNLSSPFYYCYIPLMTSLNSNGYAQYNFNSTYSSGSSQAAIYYPSSSVYIKTNSIRWYPPVIGLWSFHAGVWANYAGNTFYISKNTKDLAVGYSGGDFTGDTDDPSHSGCILSVAYIPSAAVIDTYAFTYLSTLSDYIQVSINGAPSGSLTNVASSSSFFRATLLQRTA